MGRKTMSDNDNSKRNDLEAGQNDDVGLAKTNPTRRDLLRKSGKVGISATLAHFALLGGRQNTVLATNDDCPTYVSSDDNCNPNPNNFDFDACKPASTNTSGGVDPEVGDSCSPTQDPDTCARPYSPAYGDECNPAGSSDDVAPPQP